VLSETFASSQALVVCTWEFIKMFGLADVGVCILICEDGEDGGLAVSVQGVNRERREDSVIFEAAGKTTDTQHLATCQQQGGQQLREQRQR
jgi:hypothetical protein